MDTSNIKNVLAKLSFIREYSSLVVPVAIVLVAVIIFVPAELMGKKFRQHVTAESVSKRGDKIDSLKRTVVSKQQWRQEQKYQDAYKADAEKILQLAVQTSQRELISYDVFPKPKEQSSRLFEKFGQNYRKGLDGMLERVNARDCPSEIELEDALLRSSDKRSLKRNRRGGNYVADAITDELCKEKALSASVYAVAEKLGEYELWDSYQFTDFEKAIKDCWYSQLGYWIIEDVFKTILSATIHGEEFKAFDISPYLGSQSAELLKEGLACGNSDMRAWCVWQLRKIGYRFQPEELNRLLNDESWKVRANAIFAGGEDNAQIAEKDKNAFVRLVATLVE